MKNKIIYTVAIIAIIVNLFLFYKLIFRKDFDSQVWKEWLEDENNSPARYDMLYDLKNNVLRTGMSKDEVAKILGKPDNPESNSWSYSLGHQSTDIDPQFFTVYFENDTLKTFR